MRQRLLWWMVVAAVLGLQGSGWASEAAPRCRLTRVVDTHTPIPGGTGTFTELGLNGGNFPRLDSPTVVFRGQGAMGQPGLYTARQGTIRVVADTSTPVPGGTGTFTDFFVEAIDGITVAFAGFDTVNQIGLYLADQDTIRVVADTSTPVPGGTGTFTDFFVGELALAGATVGFRSVDMAAQVGLYLATENTLMVVADTHTVIPGGTGTFTTVGTPRVAHKTVVFEGEGAANQVGIYRGVCGF